MSDCELQKRCMGCLRFFPVNAYPWKDKRKGQRRSRCKSCTNARTGAWRALHPDYGKRWREAHPEYMTTYAQARRTAARAERSTHEEPQCDPESIDDTNSFSAL